jgi:hypothetical protein
VPVARWRAHRLSDVACGLTFVFYSDLRSRILARREQLCSFEIAKRSIWSVSFGDDPAVTDREDAIPPGAMGAPSVSSRGLAREDAIPPGRK